MQKYLAFSSSSLLQFINTLNLISSINYIADFADNKTDHASSLSGQITDAL